MFKIGSLKFDFDSQEPIFFRKQAEKTLNAKNACRSCRYVFKDKKEMILCTFCGYGVCENCAKKKRPFPLSEVKNNLHDLRGTVCKLCDRKFYIKKIVDKAKIEIDA